MCITIRNPRLEKMYKRDNANNSGRCFFSLAQKRDVELDLAVGALEIAKDAYPELDSKIYLEKLEQMSLEVQNRIRHTDDSSSQIAQLNRYLFDEKGLSGNQDDYFNLRNSYLNDVLERKLGIPITLSVVYIEIAKRAGLPIVGVGFPGHFIVKHKGKYLETFIDPFERGRILSSDILLERLRTIFQQPVPVKPEFLREVSNREILARMLRNLKQLYCQKKDYVRATVAAERITWLQPDSAQDYRDLGHLYHQSSAYGKSLAAFEKYLRLDPNAYDREEIEHQVHLLIQHLSTLN